MNITSFGQALHLKGPTIYIWYRDVLSHYAATGGKCVHEQDIKLKEAGKKKEKIIEVPIFIEDNFGEKMAIDEKQIGDEMYTIMSNRQTGKLAMVCNTMKYNELEAIFNSHEGAKEKVKSLTRDFSPLYEKVGSEIFSGSIQVGDKFHTITNLMEAHQSVRIRCRQKELEKKRIAHNKFKADEKQRKRECEESREKYKKRKFHYPEKRYENGETILEILARSRYLLFKFKNKWTLKQKKRAEILFRLYPEIEKAYRLSCKFREIMSKKNVGKSYLKINKQLHQWYEDVEKSEIDEMMNFQTMVEINEEYIMNYFIAGETNALAEGLNSKIQRFISSNNGTRDRDFFFFRLANYYA